jgi:hypothetical protein
MRIVEFVGAFVAALAVVAWIIGQPHTVESVRRDRAAADARGDDDAAR